MAKRQRPRATAKNRKVKNVSIRKAKSKRHSPKKKIKSRRKNSPRASRGRKNFRPTRNSIRGNSTKIKVDSRYAGQNVTILRKTTSFHPGIRVRRGMEGPMRLRNLLTPIGLRHYKNIGRSIKNLYYIRIQYRFRLRKKIMVSNFSIGISKIREADQMKDYISELCSAFCKSLKDYSKDGFELVRVSAFIVQGYKK